MDGIVGEDWSVDEMKGDERAEQDLRRRIEERLRSGKSNKSRKEKKEKKKEKQRISSVVVPASVVVKPSRWEIEDEEDRSCSGNASVNSSVSRIQSTVVRVEPSSSQNDSSRFRSTFTRPLSPVRSSSNRFQSPVSSQSARVSTGRHSLPPKSPFMGHVRNDRRRDHSSSIPRRTYTGYEYSRRTASPVRLSTGDEDAPARRPSPPKDMPEHIRWLHERWSKYDRTFFTNGRTGKSTGSSTDDTTKTASASRQDEPSTSSVSKTPTGPTNCSFHEKDSYSSKGSRERQYLREQSGHGGQRKDKYSVPYYQFRKGGVYHPFGSAGSAQPIKSLKEFIVTQPGDLADDQNEALRLYEEYKMEHKRRMYADFFQAHQDEEWFMEKYHPFFKNAKDARRREAIQKRLDVFMQLLVRGWMEVQLDVTESRRVRKLLDACIVLMEGGDENDLTGLSDFDYILEEKKEEAMELQRLKEEMEAREAAIQAEEDDDDDDDNDEEKKAKKAKLMLDKDNESDGETKHDPNELEIMQHAKDYSLYVKEHLKEQELDLSDQPDLLSVVKTKTKYVGDGVFLQELVVPSSSSAEETSLHKVATVIIRNIPPFAKRVDLEELCSNSHGGYLRLYLSPPNPNDNYMRYAIASFWSNANVQKICWALRGAKLGAYQLSFNEHRDFSQRRIGFVDGIAADKSVVLRDIQLCKSLVEYLDKKHRLWGQPPDDEPKQISSAGVRPPNINPLLVNLDECLAFHLQQLIESGRLGIGRQCGENVIDQDTNLTKILDRLVIYLRVVHSIDYYGCRFYETEDDEPRRIGLMHIRGPVSNIKPSTLSRRLTTYIKDFETKLKDMLPSEGRLSEEHVELLGKRSEREEMERYVRANIVAAEEQGMAQCCMCLKRFTSEEFARMHIMERHEDRFEEIEWIVVCFNNYLSDPNRPCPMQGNGLQ